MFYFAIRNSYNQVINAKLLSKSESFDLSPIASCYDNIYSPLNDCIVLYDNLEGEQCALRITDNKGSLAIDLSMCSLDTNKNLNIITLGATKKVAVLQDVLESNDGINLITTIYRECDIFRINIQNNTCEYDEEIDINRNITIESMLINNQAYVLVLGNNKLTTKEHISIYAISNYILPVINISCDSFTVTTEHIITQSNYNDMLGRSKKTHYQINNLGIAGHINEFTYNHNIEYPIQLLPHLILESIFAEDFDKTKDYLCTDLKERVADLVEYIGDYDTIVNPTIIEDYPITLTVENSKSKQQNKVTFYLKDNLIDNITIE